MKNHRVKDAEEHHSRDSIYSIKLLPLLSQRINDTSQEAECLVTPQHSLSMQGPQLDSNPLWDPRTIAAYTSFSRCKPDTLGWFSVSICLVKLGFCEERNFSEVV